MKNSYITVTDQFCGAGGSSIGATRAGAELKEEWRPVPGYENTHEVSNAGRVRRIVTRYGNPCIKILRPEQLKDGYRRVLLSDDGREARFLVHDLVAAAFIGPCPTGYEVNHKDGRKGINWTTNLEYATPSANVRHSFDVLGRKAPCGSRHSQARLTESQVVTIRIRFTHEDVTKRQLAKEFGVSESAIGRIINRRNWVHI